VLVADLTKEDEVLAHIHADATQLLFRVELRIGIDKIHAATAKAAAREAASLARRREQMSVACL
jgi:hypothetical protein